MKKFFRFLLCCALLLAAAAGALWWELNRPLAPAALPQVFMMEKGMGPRRTERKLLEAGLLRQPWEFQLALFIRDGAGKLKAGEYEISAPVSPLQLVDLLISGKVKTYKVTVPEGYTVEKIAAAVAATGLIAPPDAREIARFADRYEGRPFPDTYLFTRPLTLEQAFEQMAKWGERYWTAEKLARLKKLGITRQQALIMASIIEKETALPAERPMVAAVIYNRLKLGMPLQMDPTNIYGLERAGKYHGVLGHTQIIVDTPYSTYHHAGLPPGPIGSPGAVSLDAVLYPADSDVLYFVADGSGGHRFARTEKEHERNVARWRAIQKQ